MSDSEQSLIEACLRGKSKAQFQLYEKYKIRLYGICCRYGKTEAEAAEILQEAFIKMVSIMNRRQRYGVIFAGRQGVEGLLF